MPTKTQVYTAFARMQGRKILTSTATDYDQAIFSLALIPFTQIRTGVSNPKWRTIIQNGGNATTPASSSKLVIDTRSQISASMGFDSSTKFEEYVYTEYIEGIPSGAYDLPTHISGTSEVQADNASLSRAFSRLNAQRVSTQGLVTLGELRETIDLFKRPFKGIQDEVANHFDRLNVGTRRINGQHYNRRGKQSNVKRLMSLKQLVADSWLECAFGLKPLLSDIAGTAGAVLDYRTKVSRTVISSNGVSSKASDAQTINPYGNYLQVSGFVRSVTDNSVRYRVYVDDSYIADFESAQRLVDKFGFNPVDFAPSVYQLIPWSFLVDYVSNLGSIVDAACTAQNNVKFVVRSQRLTTTRDYVGIAHVVSKPPKLWVTPGGACNVQQIRSSSARTSSGLLSLPTFEVSLPSKPSQYANVLALWTASASSIRRHMRLI